MKMCESCRYRNNTEYEKPCIVYRDDCEFYEKERGDMTDDLICRQAVFDAIEELKKIHFDRVVVLNKVRDRVLELPSVNPQEPKTGHWKRNKTIGLTYCSECGFGQRIDEYRTYNYCPNCGHRMVEPQESEDKE